jgi:hypothetical protein
MITLLTRTIQWIRSRSFPVAIGALIVGSIPACDRGSPNGLPKLIKVTELVDMKIGSECTVIDVRDTGSYVRGHIPGAISLPLSALRSRADEIPRGIPAVFYCD